MEKRKYYHYSMQEAGAEMHVIAEHADGCLIVSGFERHDDSGWFYFCFDAFTFGKAVDMSKSGILHAIENNSDCGFSEGCYSTLSEGIDEWLHDGSDDNISFLQEQIAEVLK